MKRSLSGGALILACMFLIGCSVSGNKHEPATKTPVQETTPALTTAPTPEPTPTIEPTATPIPTPVPEEITVYIPTEKFLVRKESALMTEEAPAGILYTLAEAGVIPEMEYREGLYFEIGPDYMRVKNAKGKKVNQECEKGIRIDIPDEFSRLLSEKTKNKKEARAIMQAVTNTFLDYYNADAIYFSVSGDDFEFGDYYDYALTYESQAKVE